MKQTITFTILFCLVVGCSTNQEYKTKTQDSEFLHRTMRMITDRIVHDIFSPPVASRIYAYTSIAGYEVLRQESPSYLSLEGQLKGLDSIPQPNPAEEYSYTIAASRAMYKVGRALVFSEDQLDKNYDQLMSDFEKTGIPQDVLERSLQYGETVADRILKWSSKDNYKQTRTFPKYSIQKDLASWKPTPPVYMDGVEPHWNKIRPFVIDSAAQFKPQPPTEFSTEVKSKFYQEALEVYNMGKNLTDEQRAIASFWDCNPFMMNVRGHVMFATKKISPGGHWINITRLACTTVKSTPIESAEAYVLVSLGLIDGFISCWDEKYRSKLIRPETYITQYIDVNWSPALQTPPFPEYTSGHSVVSAASATILTKLFGDNFAYSDSTEVDFGLPVRKFNSFYQASDEAAISRMYGGIHYRPACEVGKVQGRNIGELVISRIKTRQPVSQ